MKKWVEIKTLAGEFVVCGLMAEETFFHYINEYTEGSHDKLAKRLWEEATPYSLSDYIYNIKVTVKEHCQ
jgi:hypothetical protein